MKRACLCWMLIGLGCSRTPAPPRAAVPVVAIDDDPPRESPKAATTTFSCRPGQVGDSAEIVLSVRSVAAASGTDQEISSRAAYAVRILALVDGEVSRAEVTLELLEPEVSVGRQQMAWHTAVASGWVRPRQPFELARETALSEWCFAQDGRCTASDSGALEFINGLGETVSLVKRPEIEAQLDGKANDGGLELELSPSLRKRASLGVVDGETTRASQQGSNFPAVFRFPLRGVDPQAREESQKELSAKLKIDRACRLRTLSTVLRRGRNEYEALHELEWNITPAW